ncbi:unnamed protein product [Rotaria magnacalcarata]
MFENLQYFIFERTSTFNQSLSFGFSSSTFMSSILVELHVNVVHFTDCLYLLDGRFNKLRILHVNIHWIAHSTLIIDDMENLPNLECFSRHYLVLTSDYDELIVRLLHRILNLVTLSLYITVYFKSTFIDGLYLTFAQLFVFVLKLICASNEDIQHIFKDFLDNQIISCVFSEGEEGQCYIFLWAYEGDNQQLSRIKYPHFSLLNLDKACDDYINGSLVDTKTCLSNNIFLCVNCERLSIITQNCMQNTTRISYKKLKNLALFGKQSIRKYVK